MSIGKGFQLRTEMAGCVCVCVVSGGWADGEDRKGLQLGLSEVGFFGIPFI